MQSCSCCLWVFFANEDRWERSVPLHLMMNERNSETLTNNQVKLPVYCDTTIHFHCNILEM